MRVLLIERDSATARSIELMLRSEGHTTYTTDLGQEGIELAKTYDYDIILIELSLPDMSGYEVIRTLRVANLKTPILIVSGLSGIQDQVRGLGFGADAYITKPFHKDLLVAHILALVRRSKGHTRPSVEVGDLVFNLGSRALFVKNHAVSLTGKESEIMELLALRKDSVVSKDMFLQHMYGGFDPAQVKIVDVFVCKVRKKIAEKADGKNYIETVWGKGYMLCEPLQSSSAV